MHRFHPQIKTKNQGKNGDSFVIVRPADRPTPELGEKGRINFMEIRKRISNDELVILPTGAR